MKLALAILFLTTPLALAQSPTQPASQPTCAPPTSAFDVASVKPIQQSSGAVSIYSRADSLKADATVFHLIGYAYNLRDFQITAGPDWLTTATWDINAKADQPPADWDTLSNDARNAINRERMAAVLAQRFNLRCHFETRQLPVYNLVLAKGGAKLTPTPADARKDSFSVHGEDRSIRMQANGVAINLLVNNLSQRLGRTVIDNTSLTGIYDFTLTYISDPSAGSPSTADDSVSGPTIFTALEEQLGLRLESAKGPVPVLVIDSIDRPSEN